MKLSRATHTGRASIVGATIAHFYVCFTRQCSDRTVISRYYFPSAASLARAKATGIKDYRNEKSSRFTDRKMYRRPIESPSGCNRPGQSQAKEVSAKEIQMSRNSVYENPFDFNSYPGGVQVFFLGREVSPDELARQANKMQRENVAELNAAAKHARSQAKELRRVTRKLRKAQQEAFELRRQVDAIFEPGPEPEPSGSPPDHLHDWQVRSNGKATPNAEWEPIDKEWYCSGCTATREYRW